MKENWFNPENPEHRVAYRHLKDNRQWPADFDLPPDYNTNKERYGFQVFQLMCNYDLGLLLDDQKKELDTLREKIILDAKNKV